MAWRLAKSSGAGRRGESERAIARALRVSRNIIDKYLRQAQAAGLERESLRPDPDLDIPCRLVSRRPWWPIRPLGVAQCFWRIAANRLAIVRGVRCFRILWLLPELVVRKDGYRGALRIGINALFLIPSAVGGSETVLRHLIQNLTDLESRDDFFIFVGNEARGSFINLPRNLYEIAIPVPSRFRPFRLVWEQLILPLQCARYRIDLLHSAGYTAPLAVGCRSVVTIFDLNYHFHPEDFSKSQLHVYRLLIPAVAKRVDMIVTLSQNSKRDLVKVLRVPENKIVVIPGAASQSFGDRTYVEDEIQACLRKYGVEGGFIMGVAASHPHKNLPMLVGALGLLKDQGDFPYRLLLAGFPGRGQRSLLAAIERLDLAQDVVVTGWIPGRDLALLYHAARAFVMPSLYEGFGLPVLESMASGTPVVASNLGALAEVVGDGGLLVDPTSKEQIAAAIRAAAANGAFREGLIARGLSRASQFSWKTHAENVLRLYRQLGDGLVS